MNWLKKTLVGLGLLMSPLLGATQPAQAANTISSVSTKVFRNATSIGIDAYVRGDDDTNAVVTIWHRLKDSGAPYDSGMVMQRRATGGNNSFLGQHTYHGRILWLPVGRTVEFYVVARDGGLNPIATSATDTASCTRIPQLVTGGTSYYVNQATGNDTWNGLAAAFTSGTTGPKKTISSAVSKLASDNAPTGSIINVANGEYHEQVTLDGGTDGRFYTLRGESRDSTIICGANEIVETGKYNASTSITWTRRDSLGIAADSMYKAYFPAGTGPGDSTQLVVLGWGEYIHRKTSRAAIWLDSTAAFLNTGERSGWWWFQDTLYVKRKTGTDPTGSTLHLGYRDFCIKVLNRNWRIETLSVRFAGGSKLDNTYASNPDPNINGNGIILGAAGQVASGAVIYNVRAYGCAAAPIYSPNFGSGGRADSITVANCIFDGLTIGSMVYAASKARAEEDCVVDLRGQMVNFYNNTVDELSGGFSSGTSTPSDSTWGSRIEVSYNTFKTISDDAVEFDVSPHINALVYKNSFRNVGRVFSAVPMYTGPVWFLFNECTARTGAIKLGGGNTGVVLIYHNTFARIPTNNAPEVREGATTAAGGAHRHTYMENNIFTSGDGGSAFSLVNWTASADSAGIGTNYWNYNVYYTGGTSAFKWAGVTYSTLAAFTAARGYEANGVSASSMAFSDTTNYDFRAWGDNVNAGRVIPGVNTGFGERRYSGAAPDAGANEYGWVAPANRKKRWRIFD